MTTASPSITRERAKLEWLQIGRAVAAMLVVFHHADQASAHFLAVPGQRYFGWGAYGVDFFFVLSGFIIFYAHRNDAPGMAPARRYAWKRLTRIYLPYLPVGIGWMALLLLFQGDQEARNWSVLATLTLLPLATVSALSVAWTLTYELMFYAFFLFRYLAKIAMFVAGALWLAWIGAKAVLWPDLALSPAMTALSNPIILEFFLGMASAWVFPKVDRKWRYWLIVPGLLVVVALVPLHLLDNKLLMGPPLALVVLGLALLKPIQGQAVFRGALFLGTASYSIYLVHSPVISVSAGLLAPFMGKWAIFAVTALLGTLAGSIYFVAVERPTLKIVRRGGFRAPGAARDRGEAHAG
ncbi:acyltransferase [Citromicrobium bathyomarinum]|uniref:acyltransferase family protein n=1 Tax=Citromicrobium bathyomarinum TaxID=72174 RepID=UPI00315AF63B